MTQTASVRIIHPEALPERCQAGMESVSFAECLSAATDLGDADSDCRLKAFMIVQHSISKNFMRLGLAEEASGALEVMCLHRRALAKSPGSALQAERSRQVFNAAAVLLVHLENNRTAPERLMVIRLIARCANRTA